MNIKQWRWLGIAAVVWIADYISKYWALKTLIFGRDMVVFPGFNFALAFNTGVAFSLLNDGQFWQWVSLLILTTLVTIVLLCWLFRLPSKQRLLSCALAALIGGALGNLSDRIRYGHVIDFIDVHWGQYHWPTFNVADTFICLSVAVLVYVSRYLELNDTSYP